MPDDMRSDEQLIEEAHAAVDVLDEGTFHSLRVTDINAAIDALGKRLIQRTKERDAAVTIIERARFRLQKLAADGLQIVGDVAVWLDRDNRIERAQQEVVEAEKKLKAALDARDRIVIAKDKP